MQEQPVTKAPLDFHDKCPLCGGPIHIVHASFLCDIPIKKTGWAVMATPRNTTGEGFFCPKCGVDGLTVPALWVFKEMKKEEAQRLMKSWLPREPKKKGRKAANPKEGEQPA